MRQVQNIKKSPEKESISGSKHKENDALAHMTKKLIRTKTDAKDFFKRNKSWLSKLNISFELLIGSWKEEYDVDYHSLPE